MKYLVAALVALALTVPALAQHSHGAQKGPNGGPMEDVAGVHAELVTSANGLVINIFDEGGKPIATTGFTASALIVNGADRETVTLAPTGENALKGDIKKPAAKGATVSVTLKTAGGKSGQARFKL